MIDDFVILILIFFIYDFNGVFYVGIFYIIVGVAFVLLSVFVTTILVLVQSNLLSSMNLKE